MTSKELIFEELSISDEVLKESDIVFNQAIENINSQQHYNGFEPILNLGIYIPIKNITLHFEEKLFGIIEYVHLFVYYIQDEKTFRNVYSYLDLTSMMSSTLEISIKTFAINNVVNIKHLRNTLYHEMHHAYQYLMYEMSAKKDNLYKKSLEYTNNFNPNELDDKNIIARLIYFFDKDEIEANMMSFYQELKITKGDLTKNNIQREFDNYVDLFNKINFNNELKDFMLNYYEINPKQFQKYISNRISYFKIKRDKVLSRFKYDSNVKEHIVKRFNDFII